MQRSRSIETVDDLLALNLTYLMDAGSYQITSELMRFSGMRINKNAVRRRIQNSWPWLKWMAQALCAQEGFAMPRPAWLEGKRVILLDASDSALRGSHGSDYRLHYAFDLLNFQCESFEVTTTKEGETLARWAVKPGAIYIADRIYCTIRGLEHLRHGECGFILRMRTNAFLLYDAQDAPVHLQDQVQGMGAWETRDIPCFYHDAHGQAHPLRIVAVRKDAAAEAESQRKFLRKAVSKHHGHVSAQAQAMQGYILLATNLDETAARVSELYRARWQIEQVFHRMKSLFAFGEVPGRNSDSVLAWFYGKLLVAALSEAILKHGAFSP